jgi:hypothetical protein
MKKKILFLTDNIFQKRDYDRFGCKYLNNFFFIEIVNVSRITNPNFLETKELIKSNLKSIHILDRMSNFQNFIKKNNFDYIYDLLGAHTNSWKIRRFLQKEKIKMIKIFGSDVSVIVKTKKNIYNRIIDSFNNKKKKIRIVQKLINRINIYLNKDLKWDFGIFQNNHAFNHENKKKCINFIKTNTFDFDTYLQNKKNINSKDYFVFIDNSIASHPDYKYHNVELKINEKKYLKDMNSFFDNFEKVNNSKIIIAANPKNYYKNKSTFGNRSIKYGMTSSLIQNSRGVLMHTSTAVNFAILYKKALYILTSDDLDKTWFSEYIYLIANFLNEKVININHFNREDLNIKKLQIKIYQSYKYLFITCAKNNKFSWNIIKDYLTKGD